MVLAWSLSGAASRHRLYWDKWTCNERYLCQVDPPTAHCADFYLRQWANAKGQIICHDISDERTFPCDPANALVQSYFYEEDPTKPDNRVENILPRMESVCSITFKKLPDRAEVTAIAAKPRDATTWIRTKLMESDLDNLSQFAAYQHMRVQGAIDQKAYELQPSEIDPEMKI